MKVLKETNTPSLRSIDFALSLAIDNISLRLLATKAVKAAAKTAKGS